jgi:asparaginyl-tRNA synthetase
MTTIKQIFNDFPNNKNTVVTFSGWIRSISQLQKDGLTFCNIFDGSTPKTIQVVFTNNFDNKCNTGSAVTVIGHIVDSQGSQPFEIIPDEFTINGVTQDLNTYPIAKKKLNMDYLRNFCHLRTRTATFGSIMRIRSKLSQATHEFFDMNDFLHLDPNVITTNECESGAGAFTVSEFDFSKYDKLPRQNNQIDFTKDHFKKQAFLTVSSQLQLEALAMSMGKVYTTNKSFRSEHSLTYKHVSEFTHLEIEVPFIEMDYLMQIGEMYIKFICQKILDKCSDDIEFLMQRQCPDLKNRLETLIMTKFNVKTHKKCISLMLESNHKFENKPDYQGDLSSEHEQWLTSNFGPIFVTNFLLLILYKNV